MVNKILFITLSNIGDVIMTLPALDLLRANFPESKITVMVGPRPKELFENNPCINSLIVYDKHSKLKEKLRLFYKLKKEKFDMVVDLRNSLFGALLYAKYKTSPFLIMPANITHMKDRHIYRLPKVAKGCLRLPEVREGESLWLSKKDEEYINGILKENRVTEKDNLIVIAAGARSHIKRWPKGRFRELIPKLADEFKAKIALVGDKEDIPINRYMIEGSQYPPLDLTAKTNIHQLACLLQKAMLVVTNDSAVLHLASYLNRPILAIFGPTDETRYGPWSEIYAIAKKESFCRPCSKAQCPFGTLECMQLIKIEDVLRAIKDILVTSDQLSRMQLCKAVTVRGPEVTQKQMLHSGPVTSYQEFKRILIVRTDRIGDVLLSTPAIKSIRDSYPTSYIAMMVSPYVKDIVDGNPYLDEVILYDKDGKHRTWLRSLKFAGNLKKKRFDLALILHPTNRAHLVTFFACIPRRIGYNQKLGFLLTDRIKHTKQLGEKHELEYSLDLVRYLGIVPKEKELFVPLKPESEAWVEELFKEELKSADKLLAIHPAASCVSKIWPIERLGEVTDRLIEKYGFKVLILAGPKDISLAEKLSKNMRYPAINLAGKTSLSQLASVLKRCQLFISNDSGPVHISSAVGTPVISIFGRNQKGLSPKRWGPVGKRDQVLHKEVGCIECLAHNCVKDFACLQAINVDDVLRAVDYILKTF